MVALKVSGFRELEKALAEELPKATARNVLKRTAINSMERIRTRMAELAPYDPQDSGQHLKDTMKTEPVTAKRAAGQVRFATSKGVAVLTGPAPDGKLNKSNAGWQELGTVKMAPHSYARPAADSEGQAVIGEVREELKLQIEKAKARIAKKAGK